LLLARPMARGAEGCGRARVSGSGGSARQGCVQRQGCAPIGCAVPAAGSWPTFLRGLCHNRNHPNANANAPATRPHRVGNHDVHSAHMHSPDTRRAQPAASEDKGVGCVQPAAAALCFSRPFLQLRRAPTPACEYTKPT
jgi:hypothetical protein